MCTSVLDPRVVDYSYRDPLEISHQDHHNPVVIVPYYIQELNKSLLTVSSGFDRYLDISTGLVSFMDARNIS